MSARTPLFETKWFNVVAEPQADGAPYYMLQLPDYVSVVALTDARELLLVRQYRPVVGRETLELPSGHVEAGESPIEAAHRELLEETGFEAGSLDLLGTLIPDVGRLANRMWCFFTSDAHRATGVHTRESGVSLVTLPEREALLGAADGTIDHALNLAPLFLAVARGWLRLSVKDVE